MAKVKHTWLTGVAKCGYCKYAVSVIKSSTGNYKYFNCRGKTNLKVCKGHSRPILFDEIENIVKEHLFEKINQLRNTSIDTQVEEDRNINKVKIQLMELDKQIENLINKIALLKVLDKCADTKSPFRAIIGTINPVNQPTKLRC